MPEGLQYKVGLDAGNFTSGVNKVVQGFDKLRPASARASSALFSVSQVARDLPFGFIAIQNNLPLMIDSFTQLSRESGGVKNALKGLGGALIGPAGIGFAVSVVISSITSLIQKYGSLAAGINAVFGFTSRAEAAQMALNKAYDESTASIQGEVSKLNQLVAALNDSERPQQQRKNAYLELKKEYPGIIQNMTFENSLTEEGSRLMAARTAELLKYIVLKGKEAALVKLLEEESLKQLVAQRELAKQAGKAPTGLASLFSPNLFGNVIAVGKLGVQADRAGVAVLDLAKDLEKVRDQMLGLDAKVTGIDPFKIKEVKEKTTKELNELLKARIKLLQSELELENTSRQKRFEIRASIIDLQQLLDEREAKQTIKNKKALLVELEVIEKEFAAKRAANIRPQGTPGLQRVRSRFIDSGEIEGTEKAIAAFRAAMQIPIKIKIDLTSAEASFQRLIELSKQYNAIVANLVDSLNQVVASGAVQAIGGIGEALGDLASGKGFTGLGKVFAGVGEILVQMGRSAIEAGVAILLLKKAFNFARANPALLIAAGIALTALGTVVKNRFNKQPGLAEGGIVPPGFPNDSFPARLTSNEAVIPLDRINSIMGGNQILVADTTVKGSDIVFAWHREMKKQGRTG